MNERHALRAWRFLLLGAAVSGCRAVCVRGQLSKQQSGLKVPNIFRKKACQEQNFVLRCCPI